MAHFTKFYNRFNHINLNLHSNCCINQKNQHNLLCFIATLNFKILKLSNAKFNVFIKIIQNPPIVNLKINLPYMV